MAKVLNRRAFIVTGFGATLGATALSAASSTREINSEPEENSSANNTSYEVLHLATEVADVVAPVDIYSQAVNGGTLLSQPDGAIRYFYRLALKSETPSGHEGSGDILYEDRSDDGGQTWRLHLEVMRTGPSSRDDTAHVNPYNGEIYLFFSREKRTYLKRSANNRTSWLPEIEVPFPCVWDSFGFTWLRKMESGGTHRLIVATTIKISESGTNTTGTASYYSDDDGKSWTGPSNAVTTKPYPGRWNNPSSSGQIVELKDGRLWMLTRSSQDHLWQAYSEDRGRSWKDIGPSRFVGVFSCVRIERIAPDRLIIVWLNNMPQSDMGPNNSFHNTARDVIHAAISDDEGMTWRGFREVILDRNRNKLIFESAPAFDAGVHHPKFTVTRDGKVILMSGQDDDDITWTSPHRRAVMFDPKWLLETEHSTDFSDGTDHLCVSRMSRLRRPPTNYYSRTPGARITGHPTEPFRNVLQIGRETATWVFNEQGGATWNFPTGLRGRVEMQMMLRPGFKGGAVALTDTYYCPSDNTGETNAMFALPIGADGMIGETTLTPGRWYTVAIKWDESPSASLYIDGRLETNGLPRKNSTMNGINYLRFRSTAPTEDLAGFFVGSISARVSW